MAPFLAGDSQLELLTAASQTALYVFFSNTTDDHEDPRIR